MTWGVLLGVVGVISGVLPYVLSPERFRAWMWRSVSTLNTRRRQKKRARLETRKAFLITLHDSPAEQTLYLVQGVLIALVAAAAAVVMGVNVWANFARVFAGYAGLCAMGIYFFGLYRLGMHRRARIPAAFEKTIQQIDAQITALQAGHDHH